MTTTPTRPAETNDQVAGAASAPGLLAPKPWWKSWRIGLAVIIIVPTFIGQIVGTDDAWPFAPFRMFASPTPRTSTVVHPEFYGVFAHGTRVAMFSTDFHLRPAEVEAELNRHKRLHPGLLGDIATTWNHLHPKHRLRELDLRMVGQKLVNGRPDEKVDRVVQRWVKP